MSALKPPINPLATPLDLSKAGNGTVVGPLRRRDGQEVWVLTSVTANHLGVVLVDDGVFYWVGLDGRVCPGVDQPGDVVLLPRKIHVWVNFYPSSGLYGAVHKTEASAVRDAGRGAVLVPLTGEYQP